MSGGRSLSNGILNVNAEDKTTGKTQKITITNEKGRLSKEEIERMVKEAEQFKSEDEEAKRKVEAKNSFENYVYNLRNSLRDPNVGGKLDPADKERLEKEIEDAIQWLDNNQLADTEEFEEKQRELENVANPIMQKMYGGGGGAPGGEDMGGGMPGGTTGPGPKVEEVD
ncbi:heat shock protein [Klebsormidium nitens]|uniref:Heat shock protein n=1 Tax=Klebsormidium nitens TaxID=105231 RepID=A0A1Y1I590_KLENI|nr:heat shock protein [Klebsormidium nitens]|eukprot:GAQ85122.1 heat shock protein [Klebsormidium nitens]